MRIRRALGKGKADQYSELLRRGALRTVHRGSARRSVLWNWVAGIRT